MIIKVLLQVTIGSYGSNKVECEFLQNGVQREFQNEGTNEPVKLTIGLRNFLKLINRCSFTCR